MTAFPEDSLLDARRLFDAGRWREAKPALERLMRSAPCQPEDVRRLALAEILDSNPARALELLLELAPADDEAAFLTAQAEAALGHHALARDALMTLRARLPASTAMLEIHLAAACIRLGLADEALAAARAAVALAPAMPAAQTALAALLEERGEWGALRTALLDAMRHVPSESMLWLRLSQVQTRLADIDGAQRSLEKAQAAGPVGRIGWHLLGDGYAGFLRHEDADRALTRASAYDPGHPDTESLRARVKSALGDTGGALQALALAAARAPDDLRVVAGERLMLPQVYRDEGDAREWRQRYTHGVERLEADANRWIGGEAVFDINHSNFLLAYQGEDDRDLQRRYSAFLGRLVAATRPEWRASLPRSFDGGRRLRVGFASAFFRESTPGWYFESWVTGLDAKRFERFVYHLHHVDDTLTARLRAVSDSFAKLAGGPREIAERILADRLDILVYPDVGMSSVSYVLAALRLAPVQLAGWGHPVTTGSETIDGYLTCAAMEPIGAASHYVEPLVALPGIGTRYALPNAIAESTRAALGLPVDRRLYVCAQALFKIHPEMDGFFADVLERDPEGILVFFAVPPGPVPGQFAARLALHLEHRGISPRKQVKFFPRVDRPAFRRILALADVVLDTARWSGGNTSLDAFAAGTPVVTLEGRFMRGRQTAAMLRMMGLESLVASSRDEYVRIAVDTARDRDRNHALRAAVARSREMLFQRSEPIAALEEALVRLATAPR